MVTFTKDIHGFSGLIIKLHISQIKLMAQKVSNQLEQPTQEKSFA